MAPRSQLETRIAECLAKLSDADMQRVAEDYARIRFPIGAREDHERACHWRWCHCTRAGRTREIAPSLAEWLNAGRDDIRRELDKLAFEAHRDQAELVGTADVRQERLVMALLNAAPTRATSSPSCWRNTCATGPGCWPRTARGCISSPIAPFRNI
ncbi:MAG: hypothetical protein ACREVY_07710 [Gammaproteobacteria bacterium]